MNGLSTYIRVDASRRMGGGHLSRCLALADELADANTTVTFLGADLDAPYLQLIYERGYEVAKLTGSDSPEFDWCADAAGTCEIIDADAGMEKAMIVDHYGIERAWESAVRPFVSRLMVIDDLADRPHDCDVLVDQAYGQDESRYEDLVHPGCERLLGPRYALLRPSFRGVRETRPGIGGGKEGGYVIHVFFGSEDFREYTLRFSTLLLDLNGVKEVRAAISTQYRGIHMLDRLRERYQGRFSWEVPGDRMAQHMGACDIAVGAPGQATWERACLGLPGAYIATSPTQVAILERLQADGFCEFFGTGDELEDRSFLEQMQRMLEDRAGLLRRARVSSEAVDGLGADRVARKIRRLDCAPA